MRTRSGIALIAGFAALAGCGPTTPSDAEALVDVLALEDARPLAPGDVERLTSSTRAEDPATRRFAVRALGRLEDPALLDRITPILSDGDPTVRATAAWATAQAVHGGEGTPAIAPLLAAATGEADAAVRGEMARSLGRVRPEGTEADDVVALLAGWASEPGLATETAVGVALGLEGLTRATGPAASDERVYQALAVLAIHATAPGDDADLAARVRSVALLALGQRGRLTAEQVEAAFRDPHAGVRATGARFLGAVEGAQRTSLEAAALDDPDTQVRVEALRVLSTAERTSTRCAQLLAAAEADDRSTARLVAIDALAAPCPGVPGTAAIELLDSLATGIGADTPDWQPATHALAALARLAPDRARIALPDHATHGSPFVRGQAATTATVVGDTATLRALSDDVDPNVRNAALPGLVDLEGRPPLEPRLIEQLASDDGQLLMTVAGLLEGTDRAEAAPAALEAFERISATERETARDPRMALLGLLGGVGGPELAPRLDPYLADYDPVVAARVAALLTSWTGEAATAGPKPRPRLPLPSPQEIETIAASRVVLHMAGGGAIVVEPLPYLAPTNAHRFVRLAREGYFDGLTFHRVVPAFVIQGGSPAANEYAGDGPFTRDEIGRVSHWRGTVGLSTRGRDTGDGQIFVNLVDNIRLDDDYTVFGRVVSGMDVVDMVRAGDTIERVEVRP